MEENQEHNHIHEPHHEHHEIKSRSGNPQLIAAAILIAGVVIGGAILLKGSRPPEGAATTPPATPPAVAITAPGTVAPVSGSDRVLGTSNAKLTMVLYEDFQCPFCGKFFKESEQPIINSYVKNGDVQLVYRDFAFLGEESYKAAEAARCAGDQGKFWEYHDYLFTHQNGENEGAFSDKKLQGFARTLGLDSASFDQCLTSGKYTQAVENQTTEGQQAGVNGTPKGFILKGGKVVDTIDGAIPYSTVKQKIDKALK